MKKTAVLCLALCALSAPRAYAQMKWTDKGFANINLGVQSGSHDVQTNTTFVVYDEDAHVNTTQETGGGLLFDINGGYKVWSNLVVAVGYTFMSDSTDGAVTATIPDPRVFDSDGRNARFAHERLHVGPAFQGTARTNRVGALLRGPASGGQALHPGVLGPPRAEAAWLFRRRARGASGP